MQNIQIKIDKHITADDDFIITVEYLLDLASKSYSLFESSGIEKKRKIINLVFSNLYLNGSNIEYQIKRPFDAFIKQSSYTTELGKEGRVRTIAAELFKIATNPETLCVIEKAKLFIG